MPPFHLEKKLYLLLIHRGTPITFPQPFSPSPNFSSQNFKISLSRFYFLLFTSLRQKSRNLSLPPLFLSFARLSRTIGGVAGERCTNGSDFRISDIERRRRREKVFNGDLKFANSRISILGGVAHGGRERQSHRFT